MLTIVQFVFWILLGLYFLGLKFPYQEIILGICALIIGLSMLL